MTIPPRKNRGGMTIPPRKKRGGMTILPCKKRGGMIIPLRLVNTVLAAFKL